MRKPAPVKASDSCFITLYYDHQEHIYTYALPQYTSEPKKATKPVYNFANHTYMYTMH